MAFYDCGYACCFLSVYTENIRLGEIISSLSQLLMIEDMITLVISWRPFSILHEKDVK